MQTPKMLWLKQHMPTTWANAGYLFDLPDFLTWRATQDATRSLCSTVCKWTYLGHEQRWDKSYFKQIGLEDVLEHDAAKIGSDVKMMGEPLGHGLTQRAASEMGLIAGTAVSVSIIDAHAGTLGTLGATGVSGEVADFNRRVALIGGTSTGHMAMSRTARFIGGVWGPYYSAILPEYWLNEGGQSATGALIDHVIQSHPCYPELLAQAKTQGQTIYEVLNALLRRMAGEPEEIAFLTQDIHMLPYFHGNRSPRANPTLTGTLTGLKLSRTPEDMALHYLATIQAIALGTRHIIETMNQSGYSIDTIMASGGGTKNPIFVQEHANATGCAMLLPEESEAMLLGGAMMGTVAAGVYDTLPEAMSAMSRIGKTVTPQTNKIKRYYDRKYRVFHELYNDHMKYRQLMQEEA